MKKNIETCKEFVQLVADIGGRGVKVRPNGLPKGVTVEKTLEQIGKALDPLRQGGGGRRRRNLGRGPRRRHAAPAAHEDDHGTLRPSQGRPDLELERDGHEGRLGRGVFQAAVAVDPLVPHQRTVQGRARRSTRTASCSACSAKTATTA